MSTTIDILQDKKFKDASLFVGLPGIGLVGKIVVDYLLKELKAKKIMNIYCDAFPPSVYTKNGLIELIRDEVYHLNHKGKDFLFLAGPVQPSLDLSQGTSKDHYEFAEKIISELKKRGLKNVYTLAGINIGDKRISEEPKVIIAATKKEIVTEWKKIGAVSDRPEGMISGVAGLLLGIGKDKGIDGACLMGETNAKLIYGDPGAAKALLQMLIKKFKFEVDMKRIDREAQEIEAAFKQLEKVFQGAEEDKSPGLSYVR